MNKINPACKDVDLARACEILTSADNWLILTHQYPDGDTLGSAYALGKALQLLGKKVRVVCSDVIPGKYAYITEAAKWDDFTPSHYCAVDVADPRLLGEELEAYAMLVELCIDHHASNTYYAENLLYKDYAATAMLVYEIIKELGIELTPAIAEALYTGMATDTGCFRYSNTDALCHRMAADMLDVGIRSDYINRVMFDIKSRRRLELERMALAAIHFEWDGRCAVMPLTVDMIKNSGALENDMEGLASIPREIEGVWVGATLREIDDNRFKISMRTGSKANACDICTLLGGGGHAAAAGCTLTGELPDVLARVLDAVKTAVPQIEAGDGDECPV